MHRKTTRVLLIALALVLSQGTAMSRAQDDSSPKATPKPVSAYHLEFALNELENGKKINTRQYAMDLIAFRQSDAGYIRDLGRGKDIKIGTRVPVEKEQNKFEYVDIGTSIWCMAVEDENGLFIDARAELSSIVPRSDADPHPNGRVPIVRQLQIQASSAVALGKVTSLGTADDPDSKREFQLEVTVTKLR